jgi:HEPN domain-containing protein
MVEKISGSYYNKFMKKKETLIQYWVHASELDIDAGQQLLNCEKFPHALFFGHFALEKMLKALYVKIVEDYPPKTHNLLMLIKNLKLEVSPETEKHLVVINSFNMEARYPDEKFEFYKRCTAHFSGHYFEIIKEILEWLKQKLQS